MIVSGSACNFDNVVFAVGRVILGLLKKTVYDTLVCPSQLVAVTNN